MTTEGQPRERYSMGYGAYAREMMGQRTARRTRLPSTGAGTAW
jgi:hypothetical protein